MVEAMEAEQLALEITRKATAIYFRQHGDEVTAAFVERGENDESSTARIGKLIALHALTGKASLGEHIMQAMHDHDEVNDDEAMARLNEINALIREMALGPSS